MIRRLLGFSLVLSALSAAPAFAQPCQCGFAYISNQDGVIFTAEPLR